MGVTALVLVACSTGSRQEVGTVEAPSSDKAGTWVLDDASYTEWAAAQQNQAKPSVPPQRAPLLSPEPDTPRALELAARAAEMLPPDASLASAEEYDFARIPGALSGSAQQVVFRLASGGQLRVARQKLVRPVPLSTITAGSPLDSLTSTQAGSQVVEVAHGKTTAQVVLVRRTGVMLTLSYNPPPLKAESADYSVDELATLVVERLDNGSMDAF
jgi:hypothetical protein